MTQAEQYARWVLDPANEKKTGRFIKLAAKRFLSDLQREDIYFDEVEAVKMCNFGERYCNQWEGDWQGVPVSFQPWQRFIFEQVYGWIRRDNGRRRFEEVYVQVAKKNGKSTMCAVLMDFHVFADDKVNTPKVYTAANNEDQAKICVNMAGKIIEASPVLADMIGTEVQLLKWGGNVIHVVHKERNGFIQAMSKESNDKQSKTAGGKHGINASMGVIDEFGMSPDHGASKPIRTSMASRKNRLMFYITTAGFNMNGPCYTELRKVGIDVLEGVTIKDNYLPIIYEMDKPVAEDGKKIDITPKWLLENEECWAQCNPNIDISVDRDFLRSSLNDALIYGGTTEVDTLTLNFNEWKENPEVWIPMDKWNKNTHGINESALHGRTCYAGLEIVSGLSLNCLVLFFPEIDGTNHAIHPLFWMPSDAMKDKNAISDFQRWAEDGLIELCEGNVVDNAFVVERIMNLFNLYNVDSLAMPTTHLKHDIVQALVYKGVKCNPISWGPNEISTPTAMLEELATKGLLEHFNNPVMAWTNINTMAVKDKRGLLRVEKQGGRTAGICAAINALAQWQSVKALNLDDAKIESW